MRGCRVAAESLPCPLAPSRSAGTAFVPFYSVTLGSGHWLGLGCLCQGGETGLF